MRSVSNPHRREVAEIVSLCFEGAAIAAQNSHNMTETKLVLLKVAICAGFTVNHRMAESVGALNVQWTNRRRNCKNVSVAHLTTLGPSYNGRCTKFFAISSLS